MRDGMASYSKIGTHATWTWKALEAQDQGEVQADIEADSYLHGNNSDVPILALTSLYPRRAGRKSLAGCTDGYNLQRDEAE